MVIQFILSEVVTVLPIIILNFSHLPFFSTLGERFFSFSKLNFFFNLEKFEIVFLDPICTLIS